MLTVDERRLSFRRFILMSVFAWTAFVVTDVIAARAHDASIAYLVALRLAGTGMGLAMYLLSGSEKLPGWVVTFFESGTPPMGGLLVSLAALPCGGATSPLALGVALCAVTRGVLPSPWQRTLPASVGCALMFPVTVLVAARFAPGIQAQLEDPLTLWTFVQTSVFLVLGGGVAAGASQLLWAAREQVHQARRLGTYRLVARIGAGGMGEVWLARQMPLNRRVALKILKESTLRDPAALRRFKREAEAASGLQHPHTIRVFDFGASDDGVFYIAMELLDGLDLEVLVDRLGPLPAPRVVYLARQICDSLAEAHAAGIVHCDLKPANLFVTKVGAEYDYAKVLDFGLARLLTAPGHSTTDAMRGTPAFMPPEIIKGEVPSPASDVYSMGAVLYWMVTGSPVFRGSSFHDSVLAHVEKMPEPPSVRLGEEVPKDLEAVILKCLAKTRSERFASAKELGEALASCACAGKWDPRAAKASWRELRPSITRMETVDASR
ncbi:MAG: serine/threonine protein kinase [Labilithrix sp.]|nr:serine/threonine protein kinase [Labilithrix sp.]MCW5815454.1 serine/threonine protein kinase [Labilithrix sp.]